MRYRKLGRCGLAVSEVGFGAWGIGGGWGRRDDAEAIRALARAFDLGITLFDTALAYGDGHSERLISRALGHVRDQIVIATKVPPKNHEWPAGRGVPLREVFPSDWIIRSAERSLRNLRTDCLDLLQFHVWSPDWLAESDWIEAMERLRARGMIRFVGVSINDHDPESALGLVESGKVDALQVIYNIFDQSPEARLFPLALRDGVGIIARCPFDEGALTGRLSAATVFESGDWRADYFAGSRLAQTLERVTRLRADLAGSDGTLAQDALRFCLAHRAVSTVIPGMRRVEHVEENVGASDMGGWTRELLEQIRSHAWDKNFYD